LFALVDALVDTDLVGDGPSACADTCADEGSFASSEEAAYDCSAGCGADDDLGPGMVVVIMGCLGAFGAFVAALGGCLRGAGDGKR